jgi:YegS/Rv2252/BmrU family lipid kinase
VSIAIIINPIAGGSRLGSARACAELAATIAADQGETAEVFVTERRDHARELAVGAVERGARMVLAWGGDGTINEVASALAFRDIPLGIVQAGSGNGLARELGVARRPERAIADALRATPRPIDVGELDGRLFVNIAGIGFDAHVASIFDDAKNTRRGLAKYAGIAVRALGTYAPAQYVITTGQERIEARAILITIANSAQFGNGVRIAPGAIVDDGKLDLVIVEESSRFRTVCQLPRLFTGKANRIPGCSIRRIEEVAIDADQPMVVHVDGEPFGGATRVRGRVRPGALLVAVR